MNCKIIMTISHHHALVYFFPLRNLNFKSSPNSLCHSARNLQNLKTIKVLIQLNPVNKDEIHSNLQFCFI